MCFASFPMKAESEGEKNFLCFSFQLSAKKCHNFSEKPKNSIRRWIFCICVLLTLLRSIGNDDDAFCVKLSMEVPSEFQLWVNKYIDGKRAALCRSKSFHLITIEKRGALGWLSLQYLSVTAWCLTYEFLRSLTLQAQESWPIDDDDGDPFQQNGNIIHWKLYTHTLL